MNVYVIIRMPFCHQKGSISHEDNAASFLSLALLLYFVKVEQLH